MNDILVSFPPVQHAFAYGSGVFKQPGLYNEKMHPGEGPMTDLIFAVDDPFQWHQEVGTDLAAMDHQMGSCLYPL